MGWPRQALSKALGAKRLFFVDADKTRYFPAFFARADLGRRQMESISKLMGDLPGGAKLAFFLTARGRSTTRRPLTRWRRARWLRCELLLKATRRRKRVPSARGLRPVIRKQQLRHLTEGPRAVVVRLEDPDDIEAVVWPGLWRMLVVAHQEVGQHAKCSVLPSDHNWSGQSAQGCRKLLFLTFCELGGNGLAKKGSERAERMRRPNTRHVLRRPLSEQEFGLLNAGSVYPFDGRKEPNECTCPLPSPHTKLIRIGRAIHRDTEDRPVKTGLLSVANEHDFSGWHQNSASERHPHSVPRRALQLDLRSDDARKPPCHQAAHA
jgi:hypothetical protein